MTTRFPCGLLALVALLGVAVLAGGTAGGLIAKSTPSATPGASPAASPDASPAASPAAAPGPPLHVDRLEVQVQAGPPARVRAIVQGTLPDACTTVGAIRQERQGSTIQVTIATTRPPNAFCAQVLTPVDVSVDLAGDFPPGDYTLDVNGVTAAFRV